LQDGTVLVVPLVPVLVEVVVVLKKGFALPITVGRLAAVLVLVLVACLPSN
jgi:hypothetical protein